jgi:transposase
MGTNSTTTTKTSIASRWQRPSATERPIDIEWDSLDPSDRSPLVRYAGEIPAVPDLPPSFSGMGSGWHLSPCAGNLSPRFGKTGQIQTCRVLHRRDLCGGEKRGSGVGKTKRGKGTKLMAVADSAGLPVAIHATSASPHEVTLVEETLARRHTRATPRRIIGDLAYDSDPLDRRLALRRIELIAPHKSNRIRPATQDGRPLRRYRRRWKIERLFAWLHNFRRISTRNEYYLPNYLAFVELGCIIILLRNGF